MLSIRADRKAGVIRAYLAATPGTGSADRRELGTLAIDVADQFPWAFELFKESMTRLVCRVAEEVVGEPVSHVECHRPHEKN